MAKGLKELVEEARTRVQEISPAIAVTLLEKGDGVLFLDVREPEEVRAGRIPGAHCVPRGVLEPKAAVDSPVRDARLADQKLLVVAYCASGVRSALAADTLQVLGFSDVRSLAGGFLAWQDGGHPVE